MRTPNGQRVGLCWRPRVEWLPRPGWWRLAPNEYACVSPDSTVQVQWRPAGVNPGGHVVLALAGRGVHLWWPLRVSR
jgi:hypothetical protein